MTAASLTVMQLGIYGVDDQVHYLSFMDVTNYLVIIINNSGYNSASSLCYCRERWVLHSTKEYAERVIAQTGLQKPSNETLTRVSQELFQEFQSTGLNIPQPLFKKAHRWYAILLELLISWFTIISQHTYYKCWTNFLGSADFDY